MNIFESQKLGGILSVLSVVLTIATFVYTERKKSKDKTKQSMQLIDDVVNLIVRNCINNEINISKINLSYILEGFSLLKDGSINCSQEELVKMVYTRVYENEFLVPDTKRKLLDELEKEIYSENFEITTKDNDTNMMSELINTAAFFVGTIATAIAIYTSTNSIKKSNQFNIGIKAGLIILLVVFFIVFIIKVLVPVMVNYISIKGIDKLHNKSKPIKNIQEIAFSGEDFYVSSEESINEIKISDITKKEDIIVEALKQKYILEYILLKIYTLSSGDRNRYPLTMILRKLDNTLVNEELRNDARNIFKALSLILHNEALHLPDDIYMNKIKIAKVVNSKLKNILNKMPVNIQIHISDIDKDNSI